MKKKGTTKVKAASKKMKVVKPMKKSKKAAKRGRPRRVKDTDNDGY